MPVLTLLDPSLPRENETGPDNLGDVVIADATKSILAELFPDHEIICVPTKRDLNRTQLNAIKSSTHRFLGGTNILNNDLKDYNQWKMEASVAKILFPDFRGVIAMGVGWRIYQDEPMTLRSKLFYKSILHRKRRHAVRDQYTFQKITQSGINNVLNTSCPTAWSLEGRRTKRLSPTAPQNLVFSLTDYRPSEERDNQLLRILLDHAAGTLTFFPQGSQDVAYIDSLPEYRGNRARIKILKRDIAALNEAAKDPQSVYVGTRLHGGIRFLQSGRDALILCVDNRAAEIHKDIRLPAVARDDLAGVSNWLQGKLDFGAMKLPLAAINAWKSQFSS